MTSINEVRQRFGYITAARSHFSVGEGMASPKDIVFAASSRGNRAVILTDTMSISGMIDLFSASNKKGVKPVIGCRLRIVEDLAYRPPSRDSSEKARKILEWYPKVYVKNDDGIKDLMRLLSIANDDDHFYKVSRLCFEDLIDALSMGNLAFSTGDMYSVFHASKKTYCYDDIINKILSHCAHSDVFVELVPIDTLLFDSLNKKAIELANEKCLKTLLTYPVFYKDESDADSRDILNVITSNNKVGSKWLNTPYVRDFSVKTPERMLKKVVEAKLRVGGNWKVAIDGVASLVDLCKYEWKKQDVSLPIMSENETASLMNEVAKGWRKRLGKETMGYKPDASMIPEYKKRLLYEIGVLKKMGFQRYFLVVQDLVKWAKSEGIFVGPGRGSVGGSLVAYLMGITDVDPIRFGLIFERFINPDRLDLPDADLDFMSERRGEVIEYLVKKYGDDRVAGISNYSTLGPASALRDCGRVHGLSGIELTPTKFIGDHETLDEAAEGIPEIQSFRDEHLGIWRHSVRIQGSLRNMGKHAAGVVVAGEPIVNRAVVERRSGAKIVNWDKRSVEDWGLVKIDILGLSTLDVLDLASEYIKKKTGFRVDYISLRLDDYDVLKSFGDGDTVGVFQFESAGMRKLLRDLASVESLSFDDLSAATSLYRPGPMESGLLDDYVNIKKGVDDPYYEHNNMKSGLSETYGVIVYQEQIMQVSRDLAGFSMTDADHLRKAMGKKDKAKMASMRQEFVDGCKRHSGVEESLSGPLFDKIEKFAGYCFNKSHAVEYSIISYWCAWLKSYHPAEFYAAALTIVDKEDKLKNLTSDAESRGIVVVPPDINISTEIFEIRESRHTDETLLYAPFGKLKGLSENTANAIIAARQKRIQDKGSSIFDDKEDFLNMVNKTKCNKRHQSVLDDVGAFASIEVGQLAARHPDRLRLQMELMPGIVAANIKADRYTKMDGPTKGVLGKIINDVRMCSACDLAGGSHAMPSFGSKVKFMVVSDCPSWSEDADGKMLSGISSKPILESMKIAGLKKSHGYYTSLVRSPKSGKTLTNDQINGCSGFLNREVELIKPPVIVCLGGASIRHFVPDVKGGWSDLCGKIVYDPRLDASVVFGLNPGMTAFRSEAQEMLNDVFRKVQNLVE